MGFALKCSIFYLSESGVKISFVYFWHEYHCWFLIYRDLILRQSMKSRDNYLVVVRSPVEVKRLVSRNNKGWKLEMRFSFLPSHNFVTINEICFHKMQNVSFQDIPRLRTSSSLDRMHDVHVMTWKSRFPQETLFCCYFL